MNKHSSMNINHKCTISRFNSGRCDHKIKAYKIEGQGLEYALNPLKFFKVFASFLCFAELTQKEYEFGTLTSLPSFYFSSLYSLCKFVVIFFSLVIIVTYSLPKFLQTERRRKEKQSERKLEKNHSQQCSQCSSSSRLRSPSTFPVAVPGVPHRSRSRPRRSQLLPDAQSCSQRPPRRSRTFLDAFPKFPAAKKKSKMKSAAPTPSTATNPATCRTESEIEHLQRSSL